MKNKLHQKFQVGDKAFHENKPVTVTDVFWNGLTWMCSIDGSIEGLSCGQDYLQKKTMNPTCQQCGKDVPSGQSYCNDNCRDAWMDEEIAVAPPSASDIRRQERERAPLVKPKAKDVYTREGWDL